MIRYLRLLSMAGALALCHFPTTADAYWGRSFGSGGGSAGSYGSGGGYGSSGGGSWGGSVGGSTGGSVGGSSGGYVAASHSHGGSVGGSSGHHVGPLKRLFAAIRSHHVARRAQHGSSGGSTGGSSGGSTGYVAYSSHGGSSGGASYGGSSGGYAVASHGSSGGAMSHSYSVPMAAPMTIDSGYGYESSVIDPGYSSEGDSGPSVMGSGEAAPANPEDSSRRAPVAPSLNQDSALLTVAVPEDATVTVNGHATKSEGSIRQFMSRGLQKGYVYTYVVNVDYTIDGEKKSDSKSIKLRPGDTERVVFDATADVQQDVASEAKPASSATDLVTEVKIHVPVGATVKLAGNETVGSGELRTFRTKQLKSGEQWDGYKVQVTAEINGRPISKERTVNLAAGSSTELFFDFEESSIAKN